MVLMSVGDHESFQFGRVILQICHVRDHQVDAQHVILRECQSTVHDHDTVFIFKGSNVHADLLKAAQRDDP